MQTRPEIPRRGRVMAFLAVAVLVAFAWSALKSVRPAPVSGHLQPVCRVPDFQLLDQTGNPFGLADLKGTIWVANFVFTRGKDSCPLLSSRMAELNKTVGRTGNWVVLVTFTVDPEFDRPEILASYSATLGAGSGRWKFLTGSKAEIESLLTGLHLQPPANAPSGTPAPPARFVLVDAGGRLRGFQDGNDPEVLQKLLMDIGDLMRENPTRDP